MSRPAVLVSLALAFGIVAATGLPAVAEDPPTTPGSGIEYVSSDGSQVGTITVREVADPFVDFAPGASPALDQRYVSLTVRFEATGDKPFDAEPSRIFIQDGNGYIYGPTDINRPPDALPPALDDQSLLPGDRVTGVIGYLMPNDAVIDAILYSPRPANADGVAYQPESGVHLLPLLDELSNEVPALGTAVADVSPDESSAGTVTISGITDPFSPFVPASSPGTGSVLGSPPAVIAPDPALRYVLVDVVFEAAPDKVFQSAPWFIVLHDTEGNQWGYSDISLAPDSPTRVVSNRLMGPDDRVSGVVGFAVPASAVIDEVLYEPPYAVRRIPVADLTKSE